MKTFNEIMEGFMKWKDVKNPHIKKKAGSLLKSIDVGEVLAYSAEHGEFSVFKNEKEFAAAQKGKGKAMKWIKVEGKSIDGKPLNEVFDFKAAVKLGMLDKTDKRYFDDIEKKKWKVEEFNLTSKGFEVTVMSGSKKKTFTGKNPTEALKIAIKKI